MPAVSPSGQFSGEGAKGSGLTWLVFFRLCALTASGLPMVLLAPDAGAAHWVWLALWAPAAGALGASLHPRWLVLCVPLFWGLMLAGFVPGDLHLAQATGAVGSLYMAGLASVGRSKSPLSASAAWLTLSATLAALPGAAGLWDQAPGADWLIATLNLSPVVWVTENAGLDWMRHVSLYEMAGAGDLGPEQRVAWNGGWITWTPLIVLSALALVRGRRQPAP